ESAREPDVNGRARRRRADEQHAGAVSYSLGGAAGLSRSYEPGLVQGPGRRERRAGAVAAAAARSEDSMKRLLTVSGIQGDYTRTHEFLRAVSEPRPAAEPYADQREVRGARGGKNLEVAREQDGVAPAPRTQSGSRFFYRTEKKGGEPWLRMSSSSIPRCATANRRPETRCLRRRNCDWPANWTRSGWTSSRPGSRRHPRASGAAFSKSPRRSIAPPSRRWRAVTIGISTRRAKRCSRRSASASTCSSRRPICTSSRS